MNNFNIVGKIKRITQVNDKVSYMTVCVRHNANQYEFLDVVCFNPEFINKYFKPDKWVGVTGHIHNNATEKDGKKIYKTELIGDNFFFCGDNTNNFVSDKNEFDEKTPFDIIDELYNP